jgi:hypothetical protein
MATPEAKLDDAARVPRSMEPTRGLVVSEVEDGGARLRPGDPVWILAAAAGGKLPVEHANARLEVPMGAVVPCPIAAPALAELRGLDDCFGRRWWRFSVVHASKQHWFRLLRCRRHGALFLEDARGGVGVYTRTIYVGRSDEDPETIWARYHAMSDDWLNWQRIAL